MMGMWKFMILFFFYLWRFGNFLLCNGKKEGFLFLRSLYLEVDEKYNILR